VSDLEPSKAVEALHRKLNPLLECFLNIYRNICNISDETENKDIKNKDADFFERFFNIIYIVN